MGALAALDESLALTVLGGEPGLLPSGVRRVAGSSHPPTNAGWMLVGLPRAARRAGVDVLHAPAYTAPFWSAIPVVLTIHDVSYARHPEWYPYRRDLIRRAFYRRSARSATAIITDSTFSSSEIRAAYGVAADRVTVVPLGVEATFAAQDSPPKEHTVPCELPGGVTLPFVLHVGDLHERRNLAVLLDAVLEARRRSGAPTAMSLVLAGVDRGVGDALCARASAAGAPQAVARLGAVDEAQLLALYRSATALVYPSLYEGFGLPLVEAMACGTPVIASRVASMPEVVGDAGLLLDPHDVTAWADAIMRVASDRTLHDRLRRQGLERAAEFTWERTARLTLDVYRRVARGARTRNREQEHAP